MKLNLKVFLNKKNGQPVVYLPKKVFIKLPENVELKVPKKNFKFRQGGLGW